ncbi:MAG: type II toxin-antitoxin system Phd/YefM family antitoxin [Deltaproteobacteria bacterium]
MDISIYEAKAALSKLVRRAAAGEEIVITRHGRPAARIVALRSAGAKRQLGALAGRLEVPDDFDAPLPDDLLDAFEGKGES